MSVSFKLTLELATPFIMGTLRTTLDGLLSAAVFRERGLMCTDTIPYIPLRQEAGIFKGSSLFCSRRNTSENVDRVMKLSGAADLGVDLFQPQNKRGRYLKIDTTKGAYKAVLSAYEGINCREVYFWGVGDPDRTVELIQTYIMGVGKRANAGAGQISSLHWEKSEDFSWMTENGKPARPIPIHLWNEISGGRPAASGVVAVAIPYWSGEHVAGVFPSDLVA